MSNPFSFSTKQAARLLNVSPETLRVAVSRNGAYRGVRPRKPGNRLLWPRAETMALAGLHATNHRTVIDLRATAPWFDSLQIPADDPIGERIALALNDIRDLPEQDPACRLDEWHAIRGWINAASRRFLAAQPRLSAEQITEGRRLQGLAIAGLVNSLPPELLDQCAQDVAGAQQ